MDYYLFLEEDKTTGDINYDSHLLGTDNGFGSFWTGVAFEILLKCKRDPTLLENCTIKTDKNQTITITKFLTIIDELKLIYQ